jgi:hypothetical protein
VLCQDVLRIGEVEGLRFTDFYVATSSQAKRLFLRDSKWRKGRAVYLTDMTLEALNASLHVRGGEPVGDYVFGVDYATLPIAGSPFFFFNPHMTVGAKNNTLCYLSLYCFYDIPLVDHLAYIHFLIPIEVMEGQN